MRLLSRWAAQAPVPVFAAPGGGCGLLLAELQADPRVRVVASPRHAAVLVAAGRFPEEMATALARVHDQLPPPRATVWWTADAGGPRPPALGRSATVSAGGELAGGVVPAVIAAFRGALDGDGDDRDVGADRPPNPFDGLGDHGQGGEGMMGGVPFGRPMAMTGDDRDGLALDQLHVTMGPFLVGFPPGLRVEAVLQGGVVQEATLGVLPLGKGPDLDDADPATPEGRARHRLRWLTGALRLGGLGGLASRTAALAAGPAPPGADDAAGLARRVRRSGLPASWAGIGVLDGADARDRLLARLSLSDDSQPPGCPLGEVGALLEGLDWADAVTTICSLDLDTADAPAAAPR